MRFSTLAEEDITQSAARPPPLHRGGRVKMQCKRKTALYFHCSLHLCHSSCSWSFTFCSWTLTTCSSILAVCLMRFIFVSPSPHHVLWPTTLHTRPASASHLHPALPPLSVHLLLLLLLPPLLSLPHFYSRPECQTGMSDRLWSASLRVFLSWNKTICSAVCVWERRAALALLPASAPRGWAWVWGGGRHRKTTTLLSALHLSPVVCSVSISLHRWGASDACRRAAGCWVELIHNSGHFRTHHALD